MNEITLDGRINEHGKLMIAHDEDYINFLNFNKQSRVKIKVQALSDKDPLLSAWYFQNVIIAKFRQGLMKVGYDYNDLETLDFIKKNCSLDMDSVKDTKFYNRLNEWCKRYAAENLDTVIND